MPRRSVGGMQALKDANLKLSDINEVILVGGSTRIPAVQVVYFLQPLCHIICKERGLPSFMLMHKCPEFVIGLLLVMYIEVYDTPVGSLASRDAVVTCELLFRDLCFCLGHDVGMCVRPC